METWDGCLVSVEGQVKEAGEKSAGNQAERGTSMGKTIGLHINNVHLGA